MEENPSNPSLKPNIINVAPCYCQSKTTAHITVGNACISWRRYVAHTDLDVQVIFTYNTTKDLYINVQTAARGGAIF